MAELTRRYLIAGKVQGVYFRHSTRIEAERLRLSGVARNLADGGVEVIVQGDAEALKQLREWLSHGPSGARVEQVRELDDEQIPLIPVPGQFLVR